MLVVNSILAGNEESYEAGQQTVTRTSSMYHLSMGTTSSFQIDSPKTDHRHDCDLRAKSRCLEDGSSDGLWEDDL